MVTLLLFSVTRASHGAVHRNPYVLALAVRGCCSMLAKGKDAASVVSSAAVSFGTYALMSSD